MKEIKINDNIYESLESLTKHYDFETFNDCIEFLIDLYRYEYGR